MGLADAFQIFSPALGTFSWAWYKPRAVSDIILKAPDKRAAPS
jgi:hypothetical protein